MLNAEPYTIVGIAPEGFRFSGPNADRCDVWTPLAVSFGEYAKESTSGRGDHEFMVIGRRKPGVTVAQAQAQLTGVAQRLESEHPDSNTNMGIAVVDLHEGLVGPSRTSVWVLFTGIALVFVVACANVANLLLTRAQSRHAEMALRAALGATAGRLAAQVLTETVLVFLLGSVGGSILAVWLVDLFASGVVAGGGGRAIDIRVDGVALLFSVGTSLACGVVFGLLPAMGVARLPPQTVLKESAARAGVSRSQRRVRGALVIAQVALACALLVGAGLALKSFAKLASTPPGFDPENLATASITVPESRAQGDRLVQFYSEVLAKVAAQPGVASVAVNSTLPMGGSNSESSIQIEGRPRYAFGEEPSIARDVVTPGYFATMGIPLLRGRDFSDADRKDSRRVIVISQAAADKFFPGEDPIGHRLSWDEDKDGTSRDWREIVGVVGDVRRLGLAAPIDAGVLRAAGPGPGPMDEARGPLLACLRASQGAAGHRAIRRRGTGRLPRSPHGRPRRRVGRNAAVRRLAPRGLRGRRAAPGHARHLRPGVVHDQPAVARARDPHGPRIVVARGRRPRPRRRHPPPGSGPRGRRLRRGRRGQRPRRSPRRGQRLRSAGIPRHLHAPLRRRPRRMRRASVACGADPAGRCSAV